jgi:hypothetical protein
LGFVVFSGSLAAKLRKFSSMFWELLFKSTGWWPILEPQKLRPPIFMAFTVLVTCEKLVDIHINLHCPLGALSKN